MAREDSERELKAFDRFLDEWSRRDFLKRAGGAAAFSAFMAGGISFLEACANNSSTKTPSSVTPVKGGHLTEGGPSDILDFSAVNPRGSAGQVIIPMLFDPLYSFTPTGDLVPRIASAQPSISADGLTYTVPLKKNVTWTDGSPLNGDDVVFTYSVVYDPQNKYSAVLSTPRATMQPILASVQATDPFTIVFKLKSPFAPFMSAFGNIPIWPQKVLSSMTGPQIQASTFVTTAPTVTSGVFKFVEWKKGDHITLARNDSYYAGPAYVDNFVYKPVPQTASLINQLKTGELDVAKVYSPGAYEDLKTADNLGLILVPESSVLAAWFNQDPAKAASKMFSSKAVRQAFAYGLDRSGINTAAYFKTGQVVDSDWPPFSWAFDANPKQKYAFNAAKANQMLDSEGWAKNANGIREKGGVQLKFEINPPDTGPEYTQAAQVAQQNWKALGVDVSVRVVTFAEYQKQQAVDRTFAVFIQRITISNPDPDASSWFASTSTGAGGGNAYHYVNTQVDQLLSQAASITDRAKRKQLYFQVQDILSEDVPVAPICSLVDIWAYNKRVHGMGPNEIGTWTFQYARSLMNKVFVTTS